MHCPVCRDEYRPGFTRCATCDVDLVATLDDPAPEKAPAVIAEVAAAEGTVNFCGFLTLEEARAARDTVRATGRRAEILICEAPAAVRSEPIKEEFWLRIVPSDARAVAGLVGFEPQPVPEGDDAFTCSACGATVKSTDAECPGCGLGFEE